MGQKLMGVVSELGAPDARTIRMVLKEPYGLVLQSLGKPSSNVPFMMPKKTAETDPMQQIKREDVIGSGPFIFKADEWKPGEKTVYVKNTKYKPRSEPASGLAGGKVPTPHIDSIARGGVEFRNGYSGNATCAPSRAATGSPARTSPPTPGRSRTSRER